MSKKTATLQKIIGLFNRKELGFELVDSEAIRSAFATETQDGKELTCPYFVVPFQDTFGDVYCRFTINPFIPRPREGHPPLLYYVVGQINHRIPHLKFSFDNDHDLELVYDFDADQLNEDVLDSIIQRLVDYTSLWHTRLQSLDVEGVL